MSLVPGSIIALPSEQEVEGAALFGRPPMPLLIIVDAIFADLDQLDREVADAVVEKRRARHHRPVQFLAPRPMAEQHAVPRSADACARESVGHTRSSDTSVPGRLASTTRRHLRALPFDAGMMISTSTSRPDFSHVSITFCGSFSLH